MNNTTLLLAIDWANVGSKAAQLILSLSLIVIVHEFGHYLPSKLFKCRVEKFFLFFDPWFALVKKKIGDTVYVSDGFLWADMLKFQEWWMRVWTRNK